MLLIDSILVVGDIEMENKTTSQLSKKNVQRLKNCLMYGETIDDIVELLLWTYAFPKRATVLRTNAPHCRRGSITPSFTESEEKRTIQFLTRKEVYRMSINPDPNIAIIINNPKRSPEFQQTLNYFITQYGEEEAITIYYKWLTGNGLDETAPLMFQKKLKGGTLKKLFEKQKVESDSYRLLKQSADQFMSRKIKGQKKRVCVVKSAVNARLKKDKQAGTKKPVNLIEMAARTDLKTDPMALQKLGRFIEKDDVEGDETVIKGEQTGAEKPINLLEAAMYTDLKIDPMALQKLGKKITEEDAE